MALLDDLLQLTELLQRKQQYEIAFADPNFVDQFLNIATVTYDQTIIGIYPLEAFTYYLFNMLHSEGPLAALFEDILEELDAEILALEAVVKAQLP